MSGEEVQQLLQVGVRFRGKHISQQLAVLFPSLFGRTDFDFESRVDVWDHRLSSV